VETLKALLANDVKLDERAEDKEGLDRLAGIDEDELVSIMDRAQVRERLPSRTECNTEDRLERLPSYKPSPGEWEEGSRLLQAWQVTNRLSVHTCSCLLILTLYTPCPFLALRRAVQACGGGAHVRHHHPHRGDQHARQDEQLGYFACCFERAAADPIGPRSAGFTPGLLRGSKAIE
jgi:hypothetical protein